MKAETTMELDFAAGYLIGQFEAAYEYGELSEKQHDELTQIVNYIHEGQREKRKMNKRKSGLQKIKNFRDPPFRTISKSNQNHNTTGKGKSQCYQVR